MLFHATFATIPIQLLGVSVDSQFTHLAWINTPRKQGGLGHLEIPLIADVTKEISKKYGVLIEEAGIALRFVPARFFCGQNTFLRGLFIIDENSKLRSMIVNDLPVGRSVEETLRLVNAFQFTDKHGEVCPANWKPGEATMKADPKGSQEYFGKAN